MDFMLEAACTWRISSSSSSRPRLLSNFSPPTAAAARAATCRNVRAAETLASSPSLLVAPRNLGSFKITVRGHFHCDHDYDIGINLRSSHLHMMDDIKNESLPAGHLGCSGIHLCLRRKQVQGRQDASELSRRL